APEPAHHLGHYRATKFLAVEIHAPGVIDVVAFLRKRLHKTNVLKEPVPFLVINTVANATIVIPAIAEKNTNWLLFALENALGIDVPAAEIDETADIAQHLPKLIGPLPGYRESSDCA